MKPGIYFNNFIETDMKGVIALTELCAAAIAMAIAILYVKCISYKSRRRGVPFDIKKLFRTRPRKSLSRHRCSTCVAYVRALIEKKKQKNGENGAESVVYCVLLARRQREMIRYNPAARGFVTAPRRLTAAQAR